MQSNSDILTPVETQLGVLCSSTSIKYDVDAVSIYC